MKQVIIRMQQETEKMFLSVLVSYLFPFRQCPFYFLLCILSIKKPKLAVFMKYFFYFSRNTAIWLGEKIHILASMVI